MEETLTSAIVPAIVLTVVIVAVLGLWEFHPAIQRWRRRRREKH